MRGVAALMLLLLLTLAVHYSRWLTPGKPESLPAVVFWRGTPQSVTARHDWFLDDPSWGCVIRLTRKYGGVMVLTHAEPGLEAKQWHVVQPLDKQRQSIAGGAAALTARQRLLLGIPLHPDQMSAADWESLPGIGPRLAATILADRQKNGDFFVFSALDRVKGIGPKKLALWKAYFEPESLSELRK